MDNRTSPHGYPIKPASEIALRTIVDYLRGDTGIERVVFVLWGQVAFQVYVDTLTALLGDASPAP